jgi:hypothetical protein
MARSVAPFIRYPHPNRRPECSIRLSFVGLRTSAVATAACVVISWVSMLCARRRRFDRHDSAGMA